MASSTPTQRRGSQSRPTRLHLETGVELHRRTQQRVDDVRVVVQLLVDHQGKDTHLGSAAVVQLNGALGVLLLVIPPSSVHAGLAVSLQLLLDLSKAQLNQTNEADGLGHTGGRQCRQSLQPGGQAGELVASQVVSARQTHTSGGHQVAKDGKHGDAAVLDLDGTEAVEPLLVGLIQKAQRVPEAQRGLDADLVLEAHLQGRRGLGHTHLVRGDEGRGAHEGGGEGSELERHLV
mmetsp:Transcript_8967/g.14172  ORF Transcript_8967/g.14172 Transcript_8967/m.14172 type:complete len:234 (+) Transcript_8967:510-1211(+)